MLLLYVGRAVDVCSPEEFNSGAVPGPDFLCNGAHLAKPDFSQRVISCIF